jgi:uncharacterized membrane protein
MKLKLILTLCIATGMFLSCKKDSNSPDNETPSGYTPNCSSAKSFSAQVLPLIQSRCASCHGQYSNYSQIKASAAAIRNSVFNGSMPKGSTLTNEQKDIIVCWVDAGAPEN